MNKNRNFSTKFAFVDLDKQEDVVDELGLEQETFILPTIDSSDLLEADSTYIDTTFVTDAIQRSYGFDICVKTRAKNFKIGDEIKIEGTHAPYFGKVLSINGNALCFLFMDTEITEDMGILPKQKVYRKV